ncbi:MAG: cytoplasmic protein [Myxococcales bacterium]|nr:MAG: cytoplasmic protein [Myxococcales bacterium]
MIKPGPTRVIGVDVERAHKHSSHHRVELFRSDRCGCFDCLEIYPAEAIEHWTDEVAGVGLSALCPGCGTDSVIGSDSGFPVEPWFLERMRERWFGPRQHAER